MRSSTSNSEPIAAARVWKRTLGLAWVVTLACLGSYEGWLRAHGYQPSAADSPELFALLRARARDAGRRSLTVIGSSKGQAGVDLDVFRARWPGCVPVQLSIGSASPLPALEHLAADERFSGLVVCEFYPLFVFRTQGDSVSRARAWLQHPPPQGPGDRLNLYLGVWAQRSLCVLSPPFRVSRILERGAFPPRPDPRFSWTLRADRCFDIRATGQSLGRAEPEAPLDALVELYRPLADARARTAVFAKIAANVKRIRDRGGDVVFVRFPSSGHHRRQEERAFPRARYWTPLAKLPSSVTIHFDDEPSLRGFECPDRQHLAVDHKPRFTAALASLLEARLGDSVASRFAD